MTQLPGRRTVGETTSQRTLEQRTLEQRTLADALQDAASVINQTLNLSDVLERVLDVIETVVPHDSANVMLIEDGVAHMTAWRGYDHLKNVNLSAQTRAVDSLPNMLRMVETGLPTVIPDTRLDPNWVAIDTSYWIRSFVSAPICRNRTTIGFINLHSAVAGFYSAVHAERLIAFANQAAIAIENARLYTQAQQELEERKKAEAALQQAMNELELRVEQRTAELRRVNQQLSMELARRRQAEQALQEERALLALRVEKRTAELSLANAELAKAAQMKDAFLASMSHELRTPLSAILNISETMRENIYGPISPAQDQALSTVEESGEHLLQLINDILDLSKIGAGKLDMLVDQVEVDAVCRSSLQFIHEAARKKRQIVSYSLDPQVTTVQADARRLRQILVNLLSNAVKFTPTGGSIGLAVVGDGANGQVRFTVWDSGIGIPLEKMGQLFRPFIQLDNSLARHYEGTGLGLALVYALVELHDGSIHVESEVGRGSSFTIHLRWGESAGAPAADDALLPLDAPSLASLGGDVTDGVLLARHFCGELGIVTEGCWFDPESVRKAIQSRYDLFILDVRLLPQGRECLALIKNNPLSVNTPIILISQSRRMLDRPTLPMGNTFLEYPFTLEELRAIIRSLSPLGTASLVQRAAIFIERNDRDPQLHPMILLVDDHATSKRLLSDFLNASGYRLFFASNGPEAIERAREIHPDLILIDLHLPGMDALVAIDRMRHDAQICYIPIIAMTSLAIPGSQERSLCAGADEYFSRPLNLKLFARRIAALIASTSQRIQTGQLNQKGDTP